MVAPGGTADYLYTGPFEKSVVPQTSDTYESTVPLVGMDISDHCSRRSFLKRTSVGLAAFTLGSLPATAGAAGSLQIDRVEVFPVVYPIAGQFKFLQGPEGYPPGRVSAIVKITTDDGTVGWGESIPSPMWSYETMETVVTTIRTYLAPEIVGHNIFDLVGLHRVMDRHIAPGFSTGQPIAKSGIDIALHDILGKVTGQSLAQMIRRQPVESITLSWTVSLSRLDEVEPRIEEGWNRGYRNFNVKIGTEPSFDLELCRRVKERVPEGFLWADANGGYNLPTARQIAPKLADIGVEVFEQPLPSNHLTGYRELRSQAALPVLMDEGVVSPRTLMEYIRMDLLDGVAMKVPRCGGLDSARRQIEMLEDAGLMFLGSGLTDPSISLAATLGLYGAFQYDRPAALNGPQFISGSVLKEPFEPRNGQLPVPTGPGLGIEVDENKVRDIGIEL